MGDSQDKRQRIMRAAEQLFTSCRYHEITTDDIAREAKVGKGTIYRLFEDKDDLFFQTAAMGFAELCRLLEEPTRRTSEDDCFRDELVHACRQIGEFFAQRRQLFRMMQSEEGRMPWCRGKLREKWQERRRALVEAMAAILQRGVAEGHVRQDIPPNVLATMLLALLRARSRELAEQGEPALDHEQVIDLFLSGAGGTSAPRDPLAEAETS